MKRTSAIATVLGLALCGHASVQAQPVPATEPPRARAAPLADVADVEPAVDVSRSLPAAPAPQTSQPAARAAPNAGNSRVVDSLDLGTTSVTGNQELPKVLYIVPWKRSDLGDLVGRPVNTLLDDVLAPVDPEVFERQLNYYESLYGESQEE
jgi:hypothetical protein